jgi:peptidoglycan/xylan/chitin deacetylase (PgdA/CDA1 family)
MPTLMRATAIRAKRLMIYSSAVAKVRFSRHNTIILRYHSVAPAKEATYVSSTICLDPGVFDTQIARLASRYDIISLDDAMDRLEHGRPSGTRPGVVITFDDGYRDNYLHALPILQRHGATATFYIVADSISPAPAVWTVRLMQLFARQPEPTSECPAPVEVDLSRPESTRASIRRLTHWLRGISASERETAMESLVDWSGNGRPDDTGIMMTADEMCKMADAGMTIGAHTCTHPLLTAVPLAEAEREIIESRARLEGIVGRPVVHFSYPNPGSGQHENAAVRAIVERAGYRTATTSQSGLVRAGCDPFALRRFGVNSEEQGRMLIRVLGAG